MQCGEKMSLEQIRELLQASQEVRFAGHGRAEVYAWIGKTLAEQNYRQQSREGKGVLRAYVHGSAAHGQGERRVAACDTFGR